MPERQQSIINAKHFIFQNGEPIQGPSIAEVSSEVNKGVCVNVCQFKFCWRMAMSMLFLVSTSQIIASPMFESELINYQFACQCWY